MYMPAYKSLLMELAKGSVKRVTLAWCTIPEKRLVVAGEVEQRNKQQQEQGQHLQEVDEHAAAVAAAVATAFTGSSCASNAPTASPVIPAGLQPNPGSYTYL